MSARLAFVACALVAAAASAQDTTRVQGTTPIQGTPPVSGITPIQGVTPIHGARPALDTAHVQDTTQVHPVTPTPGPITPPVQASAPSARADSAETLFSQAAGAPPEAAESAYQRIVVDFPESPRTEEALLRLAQIELARGDRVQAAAHLDRLLRDHTARGPSEAATEFAAGEAYLQLDDMPHACRTLAQARADAAPGDVELTNQVSYALERCRSVPMPVTTPGAPTADTAHRAAPPSPSQSRTTPARPTTSAATHAASAPAPAPRATEHGGFTVQVAAFTTRAEADALVRKLTARGLPARVVASKTLFRVRVGRYHTEAQAGAERVTLTAQGLTGFVTAAEP